MSASEVALIYALEPVFAAGAEQSDLQQSSKLHYTKLHETTRRYTTLHDTPPHEVVGGVCA